MIALGDHRARRTRACSSRTLVLERASRSRSSSMAMREFREPSEPARERGPEVMPALVLGREDVRPLASICRTAAPSILIQATSIGEPSRYTDEAVALSKLPEVMRGKTIDTRVSLVDLPRRRIPELSSGT